MFKIGYLCFFIVVSLQEEVATQCDDISVDILDVRDGSNIQRTNSSIAYIHPPANDISSCDYLHVYLELEEPIYGMRSTTANFTLILEDVSKRSIVPPLLLVNEIDGGLIAGIILGFIFLIIAGYFGYNILMDKLESGVYRFPQTTETMQFKEL